MKMHISISEVPSQYDDIMGFLKNQDSGAIALFEGVVRSDFTSNGDRINHLFYEAHIPMVHTETELLIQEMSLLFAIHGIYFHHLLGNVQAGETAVWLGISAKHRKEAFAAQTWFLDQFKKRIPIWKKELGNQTQSWTIPHE